MNEVLSEKGLKMKGQIEKVCKDNHLRFIEYIEKKEFPEFFREEM